MKRERFSAPLITGKTVKRPGLVSSIDDLANRGILFIHAPAGYGKTTLCALWLDSQKKTSAWLTIDEYSCSPLDVYRGILQALSIPDIADTVSPEYLIERLENMERFPSALVIDDFHLCADINLAKSLIAVRARLPEDMAFIILSRNPPPLPLHEKGGAVKVLTGLSFHSDEIVSLFGKNNLSISKGEAEVLQKQTNGWAAALLIILMDSREQFTGVLDSATLNDYLKSQVFWYEKEFGIFKKCSVCDTLTPKLCAAVCGQDDAWEAIVNFSEKTGLVTKFQDNAYRFHALLKDFFQKELEADDSIDKTELYRTAANWYKDNGEIAQAISMAANSGDISLLDECFFMRSQVYGKYNMDIESFTQDVHRYLIDKLPTSTIAEYCRLSIACCSGYFFGGEADKACEWIDIIEKQFESGYMWEEADLIGTALRLAMDPRKNVWDIPNHFKRIGPLIKKASKMTSVSLTINLLFFHKGQVDYSDISPRLQDFAANTVAHMSPIFGPVFKPLVLLLTAGVHYERGELGQAEAICINLIQIAQRFPPEIKFSTFALYAEILRVQGKNFDAQTGNIANMITVENAHYLTLNFNAYSTGIQLCGGDVTAGEAWLETRMTELCESLRFYKVNQYFTTARAMIVSGKLHEAEPFLERLALFSKSYRRSCDYIEALTLKAICLWNMKDEPSALRTLAIAINHAQQIEIIMPISKEGADVLPILQKILGRLKHGYDAELFDKAFINSLFISAKAVSQNIGGMFSQAQDKPVKLSLKQREMLRFLSQNLTYQEIADKTGVKITTVRDHISKLYAKLGVSNAADAQLAARKMKFL